MGDIALDIDLAWTGQAAWGLTIAVMDGCQGSNPFLTMFFDLITICGDDHAFLSRSATGIEQVRPTFTRHGANTAASAFSRFVAREVAKSRNGDSGLAGCIQQGCALVNRNLNGINGQGYFFHTIDVLSNNCFICKEWKSGSQSAPPGLRLGTNLKITNR
jgi:hypothetical protein